MLTAMATRINQQTNVNIYAGRFLKEDKIGSIGAQAIFTDPIAIGERIGFIKATVSMHCNVYELYETYCPDIRQA
ncbi:MAG TPA: hypothetical protein VFD03_02445 [Clostridia bacterium]|nr:hypothetical protein [Clostridia bacterium]